MTDRDVEVLRQHAHTMAWILIEMYEGHRRNRTGLQLLREIRTENEGLVDQNIASWNRIADWLRQMDLLRSAA